MTLENIKKALQSYLNANGLKVGNKTALKAEFAGAADHKTRFVQGLLDTDTRNVWNKLGASMSKVAVGYAG